MLSCGALVVWWCWHVLKLCGVNIWDNWLLLANLPLHRHCLAMIAWAAAQEVRADANIVAL